MTFTMDATSPVGYHQPLRLEAAVSPYLAWANVVFYHNDQPIDWKTIQDGVAVLQLHGSSELELSGGLGTHRVRVDFPEQTLDGVTYLASTAELLIDVVKTQTAVSLRTRSTSTIIDEPIVLVAEMGEWWSGQGTIRIFEIVDGTPILRHEQRPRIRTEQATGEHHAEAQFNTRLAEGIHRFYATFDPDDSTLFTSSRSARHLVDVTRIGLHLNVQTAAPTSEHKPVRLMATPRPDRCCASDLTEDVVFYDTFRGVTRRLGSAPVLAGSPSRAVLSTAKLEQGRHWIHARYPGDDRYESAESVRIEQIITADQVEATNVGLSAGSFYPVVDEYRDTVALTGRLLERATVTGHIYSASNALVRTLTHGPSIGQYSITWNGKNAAGQLVPVGSYRVVQRLEDAYGTQRSVTSYVTVSHRAMTWRTYTSTVDGEDYNASGKAGQGTVSTSASSYSNGVLVNGRGDWAAVAFKFTVPWGHVYKDPTFSVHGRSGVPPEYIGMQNWTACTSLSTVAYDCFDAWKGTGSSSAWYSTTGSASSHVKDKVIRGIARATIGQIDVSQARVSITYGILGE